MKPLSMRLETPKSLAQQVALRLREAIIEGRFKLGEMIPEESLASAFGVSRTPVREALNLLQVEGLVTVKPQRGSYVFEPDEADLEALCEFRSVIEPRAAQLAFTHDRDSVLEAMRAAVADMELARTSEDAIQSSNADTRFHEAIVNHCGNRYLQASYALAGARIAALRTQLPTVSDVISVDGIEQHRRLLEALEAANWTTFEKLLRRHVLASFSFYVGRLRNLRAANGT